MTIREGGCLCGAVRIRIAGDPIMGGECYCRTCQKVTGGAGALGMMFPAEAITMLSGRLERYATTAESGAEVVRAFCPICGVHLLSHSSALPQYRSVMVGVLDDPREFVSQGALWTSEAQPHHRLDPTLPAHPTQPCLEQG